MRRIRNYDELVAARVMTEAIIADRKQLIHERLEDIKEKVSPLVAVLPALNVFRRKDAPNSPILNFGTSLAIDLLVGQKLLGKASWFTRLLVPLFLKTVSSRVIEKVRRN
jgi:hypothetical protein